MTNREEVDNHWETIRKALRSKNNNNLPYDFIGQYDPEAEMLAIHDEKQYSDECVAQGKEWVSGYKRKDGTYVMGFCRRKLGDEW